MWREGFRSLSKLFVLPFSVTQYIQRFEALLPDIRAAANTCAMNFQHVYSSYAGLKAAGLVEFGFREILAEYTRRHGDQQLVSYVRNVIEWENSLNCEKLEKLLNRFDAHWWPAIVATTSPGERSAVDSLKTLRDQYAHGKHNGTGYLVVEGYYYSAKRFVIETSNQLVP